MNKNSKREAVIVSAVRTPVGRGKKGTLVNTRPDDLGTLVIAEAVKRAGIEKEQIEDVIMGCAMPEGEQGLNIARICALMAGLPDQVGGVTVNRFCSSGLQSIAMAAQSIISGMNDCLVAGGVESMSMLPMSGNKFSANPHVVDSRPEVYISMGLTAENVAKKYHVSRKEQDEFALRSHEKAATAQDAGKFNDEIVAVPVRVDTLAGTQTTSKTVSFEKDELIRRGTNMEQMANLKPSFKLGGSVTPGNSSPLSDGAAATVVMSRDKADELGCQPLARFISFAAVGVAPELMGIGPVAAVPKALKLAGMELKDIDLIELNEAFAAQSVAVINELNLPQDKLNVNGGAIALGHPLGCTGAKLTATAIYEARRRNAHYVMVTMCIGGGQGAAGIFEIYS